MKSSTLPKTETPADLGFQLFSDACIKMTFMKSQEQLCILATTYNITSLQNTISTSMMHFGNKFLDEWG